MSWIRRLAADEPGGLFEHDPQRESALIDFCAKNWRSARKCATPICSRSALPSSARMTGRTPTTIYRLIESHGTTVTIESPVRSAAPEKSVEARRLPGAILPRRNRVPTLRISATPSWTRRANWAPSPSPPRRRPSAKWMPSISCNRAKALLFSGKSIALASTPVPCPHEGIRNKMDSAHAPVGNRHDRPFRVQPGSPSRSRRCRIPAL